jgi:hypothetical protein
LPVVPRIRFLRKRGVIVNSEKKTESEVVNLACSTSDLANGLLASEDIVGADEDSNEEFMKVVRRDVFNTLDEPDTNVSKYSLF